MWGKASNLKEARIKRRIQRHQHEGQKEMQTGELHYQGKGRAATQLEAVKTRAELGPEMLRG